MRHIPRDFAEREIAVAAFMSPQSWNIEHLRSTSESLRAGFVQNYRRFESDCGEGSYSRLIGAFSWGQYRLGKVGAIKPEDFAIIEAYYALPHRSFSQRDDAIDFKTPWDTLREALKAPLDKTEPTRTPRNNRAYQ